MLRAHDSYEYFKKQSTAYATAYQHPDALRHQVRTMLWPLVKGHFSSAPLACLYMLDSVVGLPTILVIEQGVLASILRQATYVLYSVKMY